MEGSRIPIVTAHGEGRALFAPGQDVARARVALRFVSNLGEPTELYPANPNGSPLGIAGVTTADGRFTILMPHPERVFRSIQMSCTPTGGLRQPLDVLFRNAWPGCARAPIQDDRSNSLMFNDLPDQPARRVTCQTQKCVTIRIQRLEGSWQSDQEPPQACGAALARLASRARQQSTQPSAMLTAA
jgi:hypothetical protein